MKKNSLYLCISLIFTANILSAQDSYWTKSNIESNRNKNFETEYSDFQLFDLKEESLHKILNKAPQEFSAQAKSDKQEILLPVEKGTLEKFYVYSSSVMQSGLAADFPQLKSYIVQGLDDPYKRGRISWTPNGLNAFILALDDSYVVERADKKVAGEYISYSRNNMMNPPDFVCLVDHEGDGDFENVKSQGSLGETLRTYRIAISTTGEYSLYHGGAVNSVMTAIMEAITRLNVLYENDMSIRFIIVDNNQSLINLDPNTDPFNDGNAGQMLNANPGFINGVLGSSSYDIGHVFATDGAGLASLRAACQDSKAEGITGVFPPTGNLYVIEYLAHEIGHQFSAGHSFNNCSGNESENTAYEPGSGTTVMSYAGLCGSNNVIGGSNDYFHIVSLLQMDGYTLGTGGDCAEETETGNSAPDVEAPEGGFNIPINTPFELTAEATDPDGHDLTYCWEQYNKGPRSSLGTPIGNAPSFRSFPPTDSPTRIFPMLNSILDGASNVAEVLPAISRDLSFQITVRDNQAGGGAAGWDRINFKANNSAGPFVVTSQSGSDEVWLTNNEATVTWDVANTDNSTIDCQTVDIILSKNLGFNFNDILVEGVPNTGSATFIVPDGYETNFARVKVKASNNIFFNINSRGFKVETGMVSTENLGDADLLSIYPNPAKDFLYLDTDQPGLSEDVRVKVYSIDGKLLEEKNVNSPSSKIAVSHLNPGLYLLKLLVDDEIFVKKFVVE